MSAVKRTKEQSRSSGSRRLLWKSKSRRESWGRKETWDTPRLEQGLNGLSYSLFIAPRQAPMRNRSLRAGSETGSRA